MNAAVRIRHAVADDCTVLFDMAQRSPSAPQWSPGQYRAMFHQETTAGQQRVVLLAQVEALPIGFAVLSVLTSIQPAEAELESIVVLPEHRRHGIGSELLQEAMRCAQECAAEHLRLEVRAGNTPALHLYTARGFTREGLRRGYYSNPAEDAICMQKALLPLRATAR